MNLDFVRGSDDSPVAGTGTPYDYTVAMPRPTTMEMPSITLTAATAAAGAPQPGLMPVDFLKPMPSIVSTTPEQMDADCTPFAQWINHNPLLAAGLLLGLYLLVGRKS